jgi:hypothetical protein
MKRDKLIREIQGAARANGLDLSVLREGAAHQIFRCGVVMVPIPRHRELGLKLALEIRKSLEPALGTKWWR